MARKVTETTPRTTMTTISTAFLPEEEVVVEEVELAGDVAAEPVGREELPAIPTTGVVLVGVASRDGVVLSSSNVVLVGVVSGDKVAPSTSNAA